MARNKTLISLLNELRAKTRRSQNPAHNTGVRESQIAMLQSTQDWLWDDFNWPHLRVTRDIELQAGQRYYDLPEDLAIDRIEKIEIRDGSLWLPMCLGIRAEHYNAYDSDLDQRSWPVRRWQVAEGVSGDLEQIEVHPVPDRDADPETLDGTMRVTGIRKLSPLVEDTDRADLDSRLIVGYAAAEILAADGSKDANVKYQQVEKLYSRMKGGMMQRRIFRMFGSDDRDRPKLKGPPTIYYRVVD